MLGSGETVVREPLYVFAVDDDLTAKKTDEVKVFAEQFKIDHQRWPTKHLLLIDNPKAHMC